MRETKPLLKTLPDEQLIPDKLFGAVLEQSKSMVQIRDLAEIEDTS